MARELRGAPAVTVAALTGVVMGGGWVVDHFNIVSAQGTAIASGSAAALGLVWAGVRGADGRRKAAAVVGRVTEERDRLYRALEDVSASIAVGREQIAWAADQAAQGRFPDQAESRKPHETGELPVDVVTGVRFALENAWQAVLLAAKEQHRALTPEAELADLSRSIAPRLQALVTRGIAVIEQVERSVEDPDLLHQLFRVDHLLAQMRRAGESLAVLGGSTPPRRAAPVLVATALRQAVGEIEHYPRVRIAQPHQQSQPVALPGYVSPGVVHLLAEIMDNAARYSTDNVEVHTRHVTDGLVIEVLDRGTGMSDQRRDALNALLAAPESVDRREHVRRGQIGLLVAALLARRHNIGIHLRPNVVGGTHAIVVLPGNVLLRPEAKPADVTAELRMPIAEGASHHPPAAPVPRVPGTTPGGLPIRGRGAAPEPAEGTSEAASEEKDAEGRPLLIKRSAAPQLRVPPAPSPLPPEQERRTAGTPTADLMARFTSRQGPGPGTTNN
ncbi:ATP-binding protein [Streptomyces sp. NPDC046977]|uniref:ATP-binding protein n=1 Tax=Streptomyces sp. NPDC046977 TaxID=3154703 RepID=UPI0033E50A6C